MLELGFYFVSAIFYVFFLNLNIALFTTTKSLMSKVGNTPKHYPWIITNVMLIIFYTVWFAYFSGELDG